MPDLLTQINDFLDRHAMEASTFGVRALGDSHFVHDLARGARTPYRRTVRKVIEFMAEEDRALKKGRPTTTFARGRGDSSVLERESKSSRGGSSKSSKNEARS